MDTMQTVAYMEQLRKKCNTYSLFSGIGVGVMMIGYIMADASGDLSGMLIGFLAMIAMGVFAVMSSKEKKQLKMMYKNTFVGNVLNQYFTNVQFNWEHGYSEDAVTNIGLTRWGNRFKSEDYIRGVYKGVAFSQSDVVVKHVVRSGKNTHTYTYFEGRMFEFDCPKTDYMSTVLFSKSFGYKGKGGKFNYQKVNMESVGFNKDFDIKAVRPHDAFYILTPQMMECITSLYYNYGNVAMHYAFGKLYLAINMKGNAFDPVMSRPIVYAQEVQKIRQDTEVICRLIDCLELSPIQ